MNALWRAAYQLAYALLRLHWRLLPSTHEGAVVAVWRDDRLLLVQPSYRAELTLPGGGVRRGGAALAAAHRELGEETGIKLPASAVRFRCRFSTTYRRHVDHADVFEARLLAEPHVRVDEREIVAFTFLTAAEALARKDLSSLARRYLNLSASRTR